LLAISPEIYKDLSGSGVVTSFSLFTLASLAFNNKNLFHKVGRINYPLTL
jgi:hypothetical protein